MADGDVSGQAAFTLHLCGMFRVLDRSGRDCTPRGVKTCGLLALLATSAGMKSSRMLLQDKLWSDRDQEHGAASLRQCLSEIRRVFGQDRVALISDRRSVGLDPERIRVVDDPSEGAFLEGLDVRDAEFEDWLTVERSRREDDDDLAAPEQMRPVEMAGTHARLSIHVQRSGASESALQVVEDFMLDSLGRSLREMLLADVKGVSPSGDTTSQSDCDVLVRIRAFTLGDRMIGLRVSAEDGRSGSLIWSDTQQTFLRGVLPTDSLELLRICNEMLDALSYHFALKARQGPDKAAAGMLVHLALRHLFTMTEKGSRDADRLLALASERDNHNGLILATRAHVRAIQWAEQYGLDEEILRDEARRFFDLAFALEPTNAAVLGTLANTTLILDKNLDLSAELSSRSIALNPSNPFAWWVKSASELYLKQYEAAHQSATRAGALLGPGPLKFWWDQQKGLTTAIVGSLEDAIADLRRTHVVAPTFRPALRVLIALYATRNNGDAVAELAGRLRKLEPDFDTERFVRDAAYPATLLRGEPFMTERSKALLLELGGGS